MERAPSTFRAGSRRQCVILRNTLDHVNCSANHHEECLIRGAQSISYHLWLPRGGGRERESELLHTTVCLAARELISRAEGLRLHSSPVRANGRCSNACGPARCHSSQAFNRSGTCNLPRPYWGSAGLATVHTLCAERVNPSSGDLCATALKSYVVSSPCALVLTPVLPPG